MRDQVSIIQSEANLHRDLIMRDLAVLNVPTRVHDFEPTEVADTLARFGDGITDRLLLALRGGARYFNKFVNVIRHNEDSSTLYRRMQSPSEKETSVCGPILYDWAAARSIWSARRLTAPTMAFTPLTITEKWIWECRAGPATI